MAIRWRYWRGSLILKCSVRRWCIRKGKVTDGARYDGRMLRDVVTADSTALDVWADTAYRSQSNERWLKAQGRVSRIHRRKPKGRPMPENVRRGNATRSNVRARVEHVLAHQKAVMGLFVRTIGIARAGAKITLANLAFNMHRLIFHETGQPWGNRVRNQRKVLKNQPISRGGSRITPVDGPHDPNRLRS